MTRRLLISYLTITLIVLLLLGVPLGAFYAQRERERLTADLDRDASVLATLYEDALEAGNPLDPTAADRYEDRTGARVVVVDADGIARVDTSGDVPRDFSTRPEIVAALGGERTSGTRASETLDTELLFVADPVASGGAVHGAVRLTLDMSDVNGRIRSFWLALAGIAAVVLLAVALIGWVIARSVTRPLRELTATADRFASGDLAVVPNDIGGPAEIRALDVMMATMAVRLDGLLAAQRAFVSDASHQLRTPLTALRLRLENLQVRLEQGDDPTELRDEVERAIDETGRLSELVSNLLQLARTDEDRTTTVVDARSLVADRVDTWAAVADERGVRLAGPEKQGDPVEVQVVSGAVEQILDNLIDNAVLASRAGSEVDVELSTTESVAIVSVIDHGPGLSDADKQDALRRFWRGDTTRSGTGLGLAIVEALVSASGGSVSLSDTAGGGLTVTVELPVAGSRGPSTSSG
jgi:signal transduction histidine kinase